MRDDVLIIQHIYLIYLKEFSNKINKLALNFVLRSFRILFSTIHLLFKWGVSSSLVE